MTSPTRIALIGATLIVAPVIAFILGIRMATNIAADECHKLRGQDFNDGVRYGLVAMSYGEGDDDLDSITARARHMRNFVELVKADVEKEKAKANEQ